MLETSTSALGSFLAEGVPLSPVVILVLCVVAGVGTVLLLPSRREAPLRAIGGVIVLAAALIFVALLVRLTAGSPQGGMGPYFWMFSAIALFSALRVVTHPKPVYSALYFILTVFASSGLFLLLWAEFMAAALVLIYAGAILVTYVFVIMLAAEVAKPGARRDFVEHDAISRDPLFASAIGFALMGVMLFVIFDKAAPITASGTGEVVVAHPIVEGSTQELGVFLFQHHLVNVELAGLILTVSMIGAIVIARRKVVGEQVATHGGTLVAPATPIDDNPHSIPVIGTLDPRQKAFPET